MWKITRCAVLIALGTLVASAVRADEGSTELRILKARIEFGGKRGTADLRLSAAFDPSLLAGMLDPEADALRITIGPGSVSFLPSADPRGRWSVRKNGILKFRLRRAKGHPDTVRVKLDTVRGLLKVKGERMDLGDLEGRGAEDVTFTLVAGVAVFSGTIDLGVRERRWRYRYAYTGGGLRPRPGGGGGGGTEPPGAGAVTFRTLGQGLYPWPTQTGPATLVLRTRAEYEVEWSRCFPPPVLPPGATMPPAPPPPVDFAREVVVLIHLGNRPTGGYSVDVTSATESGTGVRVEWLESRPGANCVVPTFVTRPFVLAAVTRRDGPVTFGGSARTVDCP